MELATSPIRILMEAQRSDGSWGVEKEPVRSRYDTSVTALALLALMQNDPQALEGPQGAAIQAGVTHLIQQQNSGDIFMQPVSRSPFTAYLSGMALQEAAHLSHALPEWHVAAAQAAPTLPPPLQMASLNQKLARPDSFPSRWSDAGGPVAVAALQLLRR